MLAVNADEGVMTFKPLFLLFSFRFHTFMVYAAVAFFVFILVAYDDVLLSRGGSF